MSLEPLKRYLLFSGFLGGSTGGWDDFDLSFDTIEEAIEIASQTTNSDDMWWQVIDSKNGAIIKENKT